MVVDIKAKSAVARVRRGDTTLVSSGDQMKDRDYRGKSLKCHFLLRKRCQGSENFALIFVPWTLDWSGAAALL